MKRQALISSLVAGAGLILLSGCAYDGYDRDYYGGGGGVYYEQDYYPSYGYYGHNYVPYGGYGYHRDHRDGDRNWNRGRDHDGDHHDGDNRANNREWRNQSQNTQQPSQQQQQSNSGWRNSGPVLNRGSNSVRSDGGSRDSDRPSGGFSSRGHSGAPNNPL